MTLHDVNIDESRIAAFCRKHGIRRLSLFGSILRDDFGPDSDVDVLVEFEPERIPGLIGFVGMQMELTEMIGREVDLKTPGAISDRFRDRVMSEAQLQYAAG